MYYRGSVKNPTDVHTCPVCGGAFERQVVTPGEIAREFRIQRDFVRARVPANPSPEELKDLTDFMHDSTAPLLRCAGCGLLSRAEAAQEDAASYEEDPNDPEVMAQVYPRYLHAFRNKEHVYREILRPRADVIELGPHLGGFLQAAEEWDWRPVGVDVGEDTTAFVKGRGLKIVRGTLEDSALKSGAFDGVFIWNCFEQLPDPAVTLRAVRGLLKRHGVLVVRVPNRLFYRALRPGKDLDRKALAYNNLLGFPYLYGYSMENLDRIMGRLGFQHVRGFNSELITTPFADMPSDVRREQERISRAVAAWSTRTTKQLVTLTGPWIEVVYRMVDYQVTEKPGKVDLRFLERAVA
jgi:SAM-dependent methyltransferase